MNAVVRYQCWPIASFLRGDELSLIADLLAAASIEPAIASGAPLSAALIDLPTLPPAMLLTRDRHGA